MYLFNTKDRWDQLGTKMKYKLRIKRESSEFALNQKYQRQNHLLLVRSKLILHS